jgi:hypothetical protein
MGKILEDFLAEYFYLTNAVDGEYLKENSKKFHFDPKQCMLNEINRAFQDGNENIITCSQYDKVVNGEGNEKEKIDAVYSSSLQSLLFFAGVSEKNPIIINFVNEKNVLFNEVIFEYKNEAVANKYPSSVDVVLINRKQKKIVFIESKLSEILRDSSSEGKKVIGISYFKRAGAFDRLLKLRRDEGDLKQLGIQFERDYLDNPRGHGKEVTAVVPISDGGYVYSGGIKQVLSHLVGIQNFKEGRHHLKGQNDELLECLNWPKKKVYYVEIFNLFPDFDTFYEKNDSKKKINDFISHLEKIQNMNETKKWVDGFAILSYQELLRYNEKFQISSKVQKFYRLK